MCIFSSYSTKLADITVSRAVGGHHRLVFWLTPPGKNSTRAAYEVDTHVQLELDFEFKCSFFNLYIFLIVSFPPVVSVNFCKPFCQKPLCHVCTGGTRWTFSHKLMLTSLLLASIRTAILIFFNHIALNRFPILAFLTILLACVNSTVSS